jgi:hypothetical protein
LSISQNIDLIANFSQAPTQYTVSTNANPNNGGTVTGGGLYNAGTQATISVVANSGYTFEKVMNSNGIIVSTTPNFTIQVNQNENYTAHFVPVPPSTSTISVMASPTNGGNVSGAGTYINGITATVAAAPNSNDGFEFKRWEDSNGITVSTQPTFNFTVATNETYTAIFDFAVFDEEVLENPFKIAPNPTKDWLYISGIHEIAVEQITVYNMLGQAIIQQVIPTTSDEYVLQVAQLPRGTYLLKLTTTTGKAYLEKFIKR